MNKTKNSFFPSTWLIKTTIFVMVLNLLLLWGLPIAQAVTISSFSDSLTRLQASTLADHEIKFVTPSGVGASTATITITFGSAFTLGTVDTRNFDLAAGNSNNCVSASFTDKTVATSSASSVWGVGQSGQIVTFTPPTNATTGELVAGNCIRIRIGANAVFGGQGVSEITNGTAGSSNATVTIGGVFGDSGSLLVPLITSDQVSISATVVPSISFSISTSTIGFGTLTAANARFATGDTLGSNTEVSAHTLLAGTNAASGYLLYVLGGTLTSASNTIASIGGTMASSTLGSEQFGFRMTAATGNGSVISPYNGATSYAFGSTATTTSQFATDAGPTANTTYTAYYVANIAALTKAGNYSTTLTYTAVTSF